MKTPRRIAVSFMGDMFNAAVPFGWPTHVFDVAEQCPQHTFLVLTKRPGRMAEFLAGKPPSAWRYCSENLPNNIWLGTSIANQSDADERIPWLLKCKAAVRWLSIEPMNGPIERLPLDGIHWVVLGGGPFRVHPRWVRNVRDLCQAAGVPFWMKQWGDFRPATEADRENTVCYPFASDGQPMVCVGKKFAGDVLDGRQWHELPEEKP